MDPAQQAGDVLERFWWNRNVSLAGITVLSADKIERSYDSASI